MGHQSTCLGTFKYERIQRNALSAQVAPANLSKAAATLLTMVLVTLTACGGGGSGIITPPPPPPVTNAQVVIVSGDKQSTFSGGMLLLPLDVQATWQGGPASSQVSFASTAGVEIFPSAVTIRSISDSHEARALVRLPDTPFSKFVITATAGIGGSVQFTAFTGSRLIRVFGNASGGGAIAADGTVYASGTVFNSDGTLREYLGSPLRKLNVPDGGGANVVITPAQRVYFNYVRYMLGFDANLNFISFADPGSQAAIGEPVGIDQYLTADSAGNLYGIAGQEVAVLNPQGILIRSILLDNAVYLGIALNAAGNAVVAEFQPPATSKLREYNANNQATDHLLPTTTLVSMIQDSKGNYVTYDRVSVSVINQQYQTVGTITSTNNFFLNGFFAGMDGSGNAYFRDALGGVAKFDANGNPLWITATQVPVPPGFTTPVFVSPFRDNQIGGGMAVNRGTGAVYVQNAGIVSFDNQGVYQGTFPSQSQAPPESLAVNSAGNIYESYGFQNSPSGISVYGPNGSLLKTVPLSQVGLASGIAIDSSDTKFIVDIKNRAIHELDSGDNYVGSIALSLPPATVDSGNLAFDPSGNMVISLTGYDIGTGSPVGYLKKISRSGVELWSIQVNVGESAFRNVAVDSTGQIFLLRSTALEIRDTSGNFVAQVDLAANPTTDHRLVPMASNGDQVYFYSNGKIYVVSAH